MKKRLVSFVALVLAMALCLSLISCAANPNGEEKGGEVPKVTEDKTDVSSEKAEDNSEKVETIKIGYLGTLSGSNATTGNASLWGAQMIVDIINNESDVALMLAEEAGLPNLNGAKIELVVGDNKGETETMTSECRRMIEEGCVAICGQFTSAGTMTCAVLCEQYGIPLVTCASAVSLTADDSEYEWYVRVNPNDGTFIQDSFNFLNEINSSGNEEIKTVALFNEDSEFGTNIAIQERQKAEVAGLEVVADITFTPNATNLSSEVLKLQEAGADAVLASAVQTSDVILFINTCKDLNYAPKVIVGQRGGFSVDDFRAALGKSAEYVCTTAGGATDIDKECLSQLADLYLDYADEGFILTESVIRDVMNLLLIAVAANQAGSADPKAIRDAFYELDVDMDKLPVAWSGVELSEHGQNMLASGVIQQIRDGEWVTVYPVEVAKADYVVPAPAWTDR